MKNSEIVSPSVKTTKGCNLKSNPEVSRQNLNINLMRGSEASSNNLTKILSTNIVKKSKLVDNYLSCRQMSESSNVLDPRGKDLINHITQFSQAKKSPRPSSTQDNRLTVELLTKKCSDMAAILPKANFGTTKMSMLQSAIDELQTLLVMDIPEGAAEKKPAFEFNNFLENKIPNSDRFYFPDSAQKFNTLQ